ncbi:hypothetical protein N7478_006795 [Penicillium angulare]|uniref:uncharacterized protein n=1 Tax=Penicillium angulare TaxID=116970 RepID=UPI002540021E|nr:uncharacterized protein N7478_006795 [Penicillium angulare]KAJ5281423.1 hypothetical protein N7478_006795 [Penicillium angulare]
MPSDKRKDSLSHRHRSHKGCWTCKRKRIQCDEMRPSCQQCSKRGITCEGYEIRLRWGAGIASRGRFNGAEKPVKESIPPHSKRRWDLRGKGEERDDGDKQGQPVLLLEKSFTQVSSLNQDVAARATVNILNVPTGQDPQDYIDINKHFELPASTENMRNGERLLYSEVQALDTGYIGNISSRSALIA